MINDIPTREEFDSAAKAQFDFAWDIAISFLLSLEEARGYSDLEAADEKEYWESARQRILTALIVTQQGVELALKGKLVAVSPFLLISGNPSDWPKDNTGTGISFSDFRAIDAQDLIKVHDTVHNEKLDSEFSVLFENLRKLRNKAMHTVDRHLNVSVHEVIINILEFHKHLYGSDSWIETRREFLYNSAAARVFFDTEHVESLVAKEFLAVFEFLKPAQALKFFNVDKKQRLYICPVCNYEGKNYDVKETKYAVLRPNDPKSEELFCFVCDTLHDVVREDCTQGKCPGNVISLEYDVCCTCGKDHS